MNQLGLKLKGANVCVMGYSYLEDSDDTRNSPSLELVAQLKAAEAEVVIHDPFVPDFAIPIAEALAKAEIIILMVNHSLYKELPDVEWLKLTSKAKILIDGRNCLRDSLKEATRESGQILHTLGISPILKQKQ